MHVSNQTFGPTRKFHHESVNLTIGWGSRIAILNGFQKIGFLRSWASWNKLAVDRVLLERLIEFAYGGVNIWIWRLYASILIFPDVPFDGGLLCCDRTGDGRTTIHAANSTGFSDDLSLPATRRCQRPRVGWRRAARSVDLCDIRFGRFEGDEP
jgi:hypothetical protein